MIDNLFDKYSLQARLMPSLLALFPGLATVAVSAPAVYSAAAGLVSLAIACGVTVALAHIARSLGRDAERRLVAKWGGLPTTIWLRKSDQHLDPITKDRYNCYLEKHVPGWKAPAQDGSLSQSQVDDANSSAIRWLKEYTRDAEGYPMVFKENISYGFRRNTLGLRPLAIVISAFSVICAGIVVWLRWSSTASTSQLTEPGALILALAFFFWWVFGVTASWVRDAGDAYARALLAVCDQAKTK